MVLEWPDDRLLESRYAVAGTLTNRAQVTLTPTAATAVESIIDGTPFPPVTITPLAGAIGFSIPPNGTASFVFSRFQNWKWIEKGVSTIELGPRWHDFSYGTANLTLTDVYGNTYMPTLTASQQTVRVEVSPAKLSLLSGATTLITVGTVLCAIGLALAQAGPYGIIAGAFFFILGGAAIAAGTIALYDAYDPPIPDFGVDDEPRVDPAAWTVPEPEDDKWRPLFALTLLVCRATSARAKLVQYRDLARARYVDQDEPGRVRYRDAAQHELETLRRLVQATFDAADEAHESFEEVMEDVGEVPPPNTAPDLLGRLKRDIGMRARESAFLDHWLGAATEEGLRRGVRPAPNERPANPRRACAGDLRA